MNKHIYTKKNHIMGVKNFNGSAKYEKITNFNLEQFFIFKII